MIRKAHVAGRFYPGTKAALSADLERLMPPPSEAGAIAVIAPHAGYMYSGEVAGALFASVSVPERVILLGPNHTGLGTNASVMASGSWQIPTGLVEVDSMLAERLLEACPLFADDIEAHLMEHSLEVELPFIHARNPKARIVPVTVMSADRDGCAYMGEAVARVVSEAKERVLIVASSDMNHYEEDSLTRRKDSLAIEKTASLDPEGLLEAVAREGISMCGVLPVAIALYASKALGARGGRLVRYSTSGEVNGDLSEVVGYAAIVID